MYNTNLNISKRIPLLFLLVILGTGLSGCFGDNTSSSTPDDFIRAANSQTYGTVLVDEEGNSLYFFTRDVKGESQCAGDCIASWPAFYTTMYNPVGLDPAELGITDRADGSQQSTYKGWPLYYFSNDEQPGDFNGDGANNAWYVAKPDYSLMIATEQLVGNDGLNYIIDANGDYVEGDSLTTYFTDTDGNTLYAFAHDSAGKNTFTNEDFSNDGQWPIFHVDVDQLPSTLDPADFGEITVHNQRLQLTYRGWPVYYFGQDAGPGDTKGVSVPSPGVWPVLTSEMPPAPPPQ